MTKQKQLIFSSKNIEDSTVFYVASSVVSNLNSSNYKSKTTSFIILGMNSFVEKEKLVVVVDLLLNFQKSTNEQDMLRFLDEILDKEQKKNKSIGIKVL